MPKEEEPSVTMLDVLAEEEEIEDECAAVLGASDEKSCTYTKGFVKRQALYSCLTCWPDALKDVTKCGGVCLACSYRCHENHELVELYTKRNFRCDCPTQFMHESGNKKNSCVLNKALEIQQPRNKENVYNQNFQGLYCVCHRPYPDPDRTEEEVMLQCAVCEDWFHIQHLDAPSSAEKLIDACCEMICTNCMEKLKFLRDYTTGIDASESNISVIGNLSVCGESDNLNSCLDKSIKSIMNMKEAEKKEQSDINDIDKEPKMKHQKLEFENPENGDISSQLCKRPKNNLGCQKGATFWVNNWRTLLCKCDTCMKMYKENNIEFLLDDEDSAKAYEERGRKRAATESSLYEQGIQALASIDQIQQIDAITEYNRMKEKLMDYLQTFAANKQVVTEDDINQFFTEMNRERKSVLEQPYSKH